MKDFVVWLDSNYALIFALKPSGVEKSIVKKKNTDLRRQNKHAEKINYNAEHYYRNLATKLKDADHILLLGPGLAKKRLQEHLATYQTNTLAKKIIGLENFESFEHKSESQMLARASKFFKTYEHFASV